MSGARTSDARTVGAWLAGREPAPPPALAEARLLREAATTRESALDLLAADALVTYAFEAAADEPDTLPARVERATARIARLPAAAAAAR